MTSLKRLSVLLLAFLLALSPSLALQNEAARALMRQMPVELRERAQGVLDGDSDAERAGHALFLARQAPAPSVEYFLAVLQEEQSFRVRRSSPRNGWQPHLIARLKN